MDKIYVEYDIIPLSDQSKRNLYKHNNTFPTGFLTYFLKICDKRTTINNAKLKLEGLLYLNKTGDSRIVIQITAYTFHENL